MLGYIAAAAGLIGSSVAALMDLRTTEVPDYVSYATAAVGLLAYIAIAVRSGDYMPVVWSVGTGAGFFALGWLLYVIGAWGGADAFVMGAVGFAVPQLPQGLTPVHTAPWPFPLTLLMNVLVVGSVYVLLFAIVVGFRRGVPGLLVQSLRQHWRRMAGIVLGFIAIGGAGAAYISSQGGIGLRTAGMLLGMYVPVLIGLLVLYRYLKLVEDHAMVYERDPDAVEEGDVLAEDVVNEEGEVRADRIVGLDADQLPVIRASSQPILLKTGVRFIPTFPIAVAVSLTYGDLLFGLLGTAL